MRVTGTEVQEGATLRNRVRKMKQEEGSHQGFLWPGLGKPIFLCVYFLSFPNQFIYLRISAYLGELRHT